MRELFLIFGMVLGGTFVILVDSVSAVEPDNVAIVAVAYNDYTKTKIGYKLDNGKHVAISGNEEVIGLIDRNPHDMLTWRLLDNKIPKYVDGRINSKWLSVIEPTLLEY